jgi:TPR repeat protein
LLIAAALWLGAATASADEAPGPLTRDLVASTARARVGDVSACYQKALLRKPWLAGRLVMSFTIEVSGHVGRVEVERTELDDVTLLACAQDAIRAWTFARPAAPADFSYPFVFGGGGGGDPSVLVDGRPRPVTLPARCQSQKECRELGTGLTRGNEADQRRAFEYLETGCAFGDGRCCAVAGAALELGRGVARDKRRAYALAEKACGLRDQRACTTVAMSHAFGAEGAGKKDPVKGTALLERACAAGEGGACLNLAERRRFGLGVARDEARAAELRRRTLEHAD